VPISGWMTFEEQLFLNSLGDKYKTIIEAGCWMGRGTTSILKNHPDIKLICVDSWEGSVDVRDDTHHLARQMDVYSIFLDNVKDYKNIEIKRGNGVDMASTIPDYSVDACFIDMGHDFDSVVSDIRAFRNKVKKGGLLCGHDFLEPNWMSVCQAVRQELGEPEILVGTIWGFIMK